MDLKTFLRKIAGTVEDIANSATSSQQSSGSPSSSQQSYRPQPQPQPQPTYQEPQRDRTPAEWLAYFKQILDENFSQYNVMQNVPVQDLVGNVSDEFQLYATRPRQAYKAEWGKPYDFLLCEGSVAKGVIVIGKYQGQYRHVSFLIAKMYAKKLGLPFISFYMDAPNERGYVVNRIRKFMNL